MKRWKNAVKKQAGMSLVEATIILMILATLTAVLAPSMMDFVDDARRTKAKEDCEAIGIGIMRLLRDTGSPFLLFDGQVSIDARYEMANRANLVVSDGDIPDANVIVTGTSGATNLVNEVDWGSDQTTNAGVDTLYAHLVANTPAYIQPTDEFDANVGVDNADPDSPQGRGKRAMFGWRGAYVSPLVGPDPWGFRYAVNSVFLGTATDAADGGEGDHSRGWASDTLCVSAGPNSRVEIAFQGANFGSEFADPGGDGIANDDIVYVISGYGK